MKKKPTFADLLLKFPVGPEDLPERNRTPGREFNWTDENDDPEGKATPSASDSENPEA